MFAAQSTVQALLLLQQHQIAAPIPGTLQPLSTAASFQQAVASAAALGEYRSYLPPGSQAPAVLRVKQTAVEYLLGSWKEWHNTDASVELLDTLLALSGLTADMVSH
jgi:hypothetical protein